MFSFILIFELNPMKEEMWLMNSCITNSILEKIKYFQTLTKRTENILIIASRDTCIVGNEKTTITLHMGTQVTIKNALLYFDSTHTLLSYRDVCTNGLHIITHEENNEESLLITKSSRDGHNILKRIPSLPSRLYYRCIKIVPHITYKVIFRMLMHSKLGMIN
jgi:hypothetical protein